MHEREALVVLSTMKNVFDRQYPRVALESTDHVNATRSSVFQKKRLLFSSSLL